MTRPNRFILTSIILFSIFTQLKAQNTLQLSDIEIIDLGDGQLSGNKKNEDRSYIDGKLRIINGYENEYIDSKFKDGLATGKWSYYKNGSLTKTVSYEVGYKDGEKITYYNDGKTIKSKAVFNKGKLDGIVVSYYTDGTKKMEKSMRNGINEGIERRYSPDGEILSEMVYKNGKAEGKAFAKINLGNEDCYEKIIHYNEGIADGSYTEQFCNGNLKVKGQYNKGNKNGRWEYWKRDAKHQKPTEIFDNGNLIQKISYYKNDKVEAEEGYKNNKLHGTSKRYDLDGNLKSEKNYIDGKPVGKQIQYTVSNKGNFIAYSNYSHNSKLDGQYSHVDINSKQTLVKGQYKEGVKIGKWIYYHPDGSLEREEIYDNGTLK